MVQKLLEVLRICTNGFASIGKAESLQSLWEQIKAFIQRSEDQAYVELASLNEFRMMYEVADPCKAYPDKKAFQLKEASSVLLLQLKHLGDATLVL